MARVAPWTQIKDTMQNEFLQAESSEQQATAAMLLLLPQLQQ